MLAFGSSKNMQVIGNHIGPQRLGLVDQEAAAFRGHPVVTIQHAIPLAAHSFDADIASPARTKVVRCLKDPDPGVCLRQFLRKIQAPIGGMIISDQDFERDIHLGKGRADSLFEKALRVVTRHDDAQFDCIALLVSFLGGEVAAHFTLTTSGIFAIKAAMQLRPRFKAQVPRPAKGERVYAIGDIHGRHDLLVQLLNKVIRHYPTLKPKPSKITLLFLGDIIDRGPDSQRCLELIKRLVEKAQARLLLGNHEDMMLASVDGDGIAQQAWMRNGGLATLSSYGIDPPDKSEDSFDFAARLKESIPEDHVRFLRSLDVSYASGSYFFVHAGVRPGVRIAKQEEADLYSIRDEFTTSEKWHGQVVVHGHSIVDEVDVRHNRIACDTAAYETGRLSCVCLQDANVSVLST